VSVPIVSAVGDEGVEVVGDEGVEVVGDEGVGDEGEAGAGADLNGVIATIVDSRAPASAIALMMSTTGVRPASQFRRDADREAVIPGV
jgi:hypothetical protein